MKRTIFALLLMAAGVVRLVDAAELTVVPGDPSSLTFVYQQMGVAVEGRFTRFSAQIRFDPADPTAARASLELDLASVDAGSAEADDELASKAWFDTKTYPQATFVSNGVRALGGSHYELSGRMTIKGRTRDITTAFSFTPKGDGALFDGAFVLERADFAIGEGVWADFGTVANEVQVKFRFLATPGK